ncbi:gamma-tubulin complex component protein, partial [Thamnocephalis sphaerospora]
DPSLRDVVGRVLPLASHYVTIQSFVDSRAKFEYGLVNHALCAAIREMLKEYLVLIAQLEREFRNSAGRFTLQQLWYHAHLSLRTMGALGALVKSAARATHVEERQDPLNAMAGSELVLPLRAKGGGVLGKLAERMLQLSGDESTRRLYAHLLERASVPYFGMLDAWIRYGEIRDPYDEFMVQERREVLWDAPNLTYWERRYVLRDLAVPAFLEPLKMKILMAGKYLNVMRECGLPIADDVRLAELEQGADLEEGATRAVAKSEVMRALKGVRYLRSIEAAYNHANRTLLQMLLTDHQLHARLRSIKRYFLLDQSDFLTHFLDLAGDELKKPRQEVSLTKLQSLLELVLRTSAVAASDPFKEELRAELSRDRLVDGLLRVIGRTAEGADDDDVTFATNVLGNAAISEAGVSVPMAGIEAFSLDYRVSFPLSLIISRRAITKYQLLFRHLFQVKHVERLLCHVWQEHARGPAWRLRERARWNARVFALRSRMLWFVQQFAFYVCSEVIEPSWNQIERRLKEVTTVEQLMTYHLDYIDTCLKGCMLTNATLLKVGGGVWRYSDACTDVRRTTRRTTR